MGVLTSASTTTFASIPVWKRQMYVVSIGRPKWIGAERWPGSIAPALK